MQEHRFSIYATHFTGVGLILLTLHSDLRMSMSWAWLAEQDKENIVSLINYCESWINISSCN